MPLIDELLGSHSLDDGSDDDSKILPMSKSTMALVVCSPVRHQIAHEIRGRSRPAGAISACRRNLGLPAQPRPAGAVQRAWAVQTGPSMPCRLFRWRI